MEFRESDRDDQRLGLAVLAAVGCAIVGALIWGAVENYLHLQVGILAIAIGAGIGFVIAWLVRPVPLVLKVIAVLLTLGSVVLGQVFAMTFAVRETFGIFDVWKSARLYFELLGNDPGGVVRDLLWGLAFGAMGVWYLIRFVGARPIAAGTSARPPAPEQPGD